MVTLTSGRPTKARRVFRAAGIAPPVVFGVHNNSLVNLRRGLVERVFNVERDGELVDPPRPVENAFRDLDAFKELLLKHLPKTAPRTREEVVASYRGDRRHKVYANAAESLEMRGVDRRDARLKTFVKAEKINFSAKDDPAPRVIQPRDPRYNLELGRYLKHIEHRIYSGITEVYSLSGATTPVVMKGYNAAKTGAILREKWERFGDPVAVGLDASRFDQHVSADALRWEHSVYEALYTGQDQRDLRRLLSWQLVNSGIGVATDGAIKYSVHGCRMSGDMNTALGNCLLMCAMVWSCLAQTGITHELANNGDDCVVICERRDVQRLLAVVPNWFLDHGFTMKVERPVRVFEQIEFCQTKPVLVGGAWLMCRNPLVCLAKDATSVLPLSQGNMAQGWATAIGECGMSLSGGVPVLQEFYSVLLRSGKGVRLGAHPGLESGFARLATGMTRQYTSVDDESRVSFWEAFNILPSEQLDLEQRLREIELDVTVRRLGKIPVDFSFLCGDLAIPR